MHHRPPSSAFRLSSTVFRLPSSVLLLATVFLTACTTPAPAQSPTLLGNTTLSANRTLTIPATASLVVASNATITLPDAALQIADTSGLQAALDARPTFTTANATYQPLSANLTTFATYTPATLPISNATQTALDAKAPLSDPVFPTGLQVGGGATDGAIRLWATDAFLNRVIQVGNFGIQVNGLTIRNLTNATINGAMTASRLFTLPDASGTLALTSDLAAYQPLSANLTSLATVAPGTSGNVLTSNGTAWISSAPSGGGGGGNITINTTAPLTVNGGNSSTTSNATLAISSATSSTLGVVLLSGSSNATVSSAGNTTITLSAAQPNTVYTLTASAGNATYTHGIVLSLTNAHAGAFATLHVDLAASPNPRIGIRNLTSGGTLIGEAIGTGTARRVTFRCVFDGSDWSVVSRIPSEEGFRFTRTAAPGSATATPGPYTWAFPAGARSAYMVGGHGGGGGGSGRRGAAGSDRSGGGGGGGGGGWDINLAAGDIGGTSVTITIGAGGAGGAAVSDDNTNGNAGSNGGVTSVLFPGLFNLGSGGAGGSGGSGGSTTAGAGGSGTASTFTEYLAGNGAAGSNSTGASGGFTVTGMSAGGGGGGGINSANTSAAGGNGGYIYNQVVTPSAGGAAGVAGSAPPLASFSAIPWGANGAGGGGAAAAGGNGLFSSGGGGGGASANGTNSGAGGNGGDGFVYILISY